LPQEDAAPKGERFPPSSRIRRGAEIRELFKRGKRRRTAHLDVFFAASPVSRPRVGIVVGKHGHDGVERNRLKRRLKELARTGVLPSLWSQGRAVDVLVRARPNAYDTTFAALSEEIGGVTESICSGSF
jgi:ribonuclease P protein component